MNSLGIELEEGTKVVMAGDACFSEEQRTVTVKSGFGMHTFTSGTALYVEDSNGNALRMDATEIEKLAE